MKYKINKGYITQKEGEELIIFDAESSSTFTLNPTAAFIFNSLKKGYQKKELIEKLTKYYKITQSQATADVNDLLDYLSSNNIIQILRS